MHKIIEAHLGSFVSSFALHGEEQSVQFEKFSTYCVLSNRYSSGFDIDDVVTGPGDGGIDGIAIVVDENVSTSVEDLNDTLAGARRNHDVDIVFIQAKRGEGFDLGEFLKFKEGILRFITSNPFHSPDEVISDARSMFDAVLRSVPKLRNGQPSIIARYVTTGVYLRPEELELAVSDFVKQLSALGYFFQIDVNIIGRDELTKMWVGTYSGTQASLNAFSSAALPEINGFDEAYLAVVKAKDFVNNLLLTEDGSLRTHVFEENVRAYLGEENPVNKSIAETLSSISATRFPVLNNGITIVSPDVKLQGATFHLSNYQIVNGCQTSNVLYENIDRLGEVMVNIKIVETQDEDVFSELVRATNSQTRVDDAQFLSLRPVVKRVEQYFNVVDEAEKEKKLYLERRDRQYVGQDIPATRVFSLHNAAKCVAAMFCNRPELASRYPKQMYAELKDVIFSDDTKESAFYASCLSMYRFNLLTSNNTIPQNMKRFKWHILSLVRAEICGKDLAKLNSKKVGQDSDKIVDIMAQHGQGATGIFNKAVGVCQSIGDVTRDRLKRQAILSEMMEKL